ncbi:hypothetical protein SAMN04488096_10314 [Mesonia phycicola]|uniref:Uncharacterized protein n=1 Tax=Mesonia phycicola TaxID=579105 RepID=A0A1M6CIK2_9FLAO|nr:hypothetical protein [Mesonia phycicola]SHI60827.1 hypothetical protein SAMN04488096_10314 [Mesonia phycicola]
MKIAILGWGSLIWNPKSLQYNTTFGWQKDDPMLPLEFSRISQDSRLTLVLDPNAILVQSLYAISTNTTIEEVVLNLAVREGSARSAIGYYDKHTNKTKPNDFKYIANIKEWLTNHPEINVVIWINLKANWEETDRVKSKTRSRLEYLKSLDGLTKTITEEYIRKTPIQIATNFRKEIEKKLKWYPIEL